MDITKRGILDILGTMVAGSDAEGIVELSELVKDWEGNQENCLIAYGSID